MFTKQHRWFLPLLSELTVTNIAHFATLAVLAAHLVNTLGFNAAETAFIMLMTSVGLRFSRVAMAPFVDNISPRAVIPVAILISMAGYLGMTVAHTALPVGFCMLLVGTGYGLNGMLVTTLASYIKHSGGAFSIYAIMNTGTNFAGALAPFISNQLRLEVSPAAPFMFSAGILCISLVLSFFIRSDIPSVYRSIRFTAAVKPFLAKPLTPAVTPPYESPPVSYARKLQCIK